MYLIRYITPFKIETNGMTNKLLDTYSWFNILKSKCTFNVLKKGKNYF